MNKTCLFSEMSAEEVRCRCDQAVRSGNPRWLWPEVAVEDWRSVVQKIEHITSDVLVKGRSSEILTGDANAVSVAALTTGMGPLLGHWLREDRFSASRDSAGVLAHHLAHNGKRMERMAVHAIDVVDHLSCRGIGTTVLKGMHTAFTYFPTPGTRPMTDIDLLVEPAAADVAAIAMEELGFRHSGKPAYPERTWRKPDLSAEPKSLYFVHENDQWSIDLHLTLNLRPTSVASPIRLDSVNRRTEAPWALSSNARRLEQPALLMHLAVHAGIHLLSLTLLRLTELVLVIREDARRGSLVWDELHAAAEHAGALGVLYPAFSLCERLAPGTVPDATRQACRKNAPAAAVRLIDSLSPATAPGMLRCSIEERFMWLPSRTAVAKQVLYDLLPLKRSLPEILGVYRMLGWRMLKRTVTR